MGFRFKKQEDFHNGFARIASEQIARATREWKNSDRAVAVHETRKCLKRLRALLAIARPVLEPQAFRAENVKLRDIARSLSVSRDRQVMLETIDSLMRDATCEDAAWLKRLRELASREITDAPAGSVPNVKKTAKAIVEAGKRLAALEPQASGFDVAAAGFERTYRQGRERMVELAAAYSVEASHDWRKRVQAHWRQLSLLAPAWPAYFQTRIALARQLSDALGHEHDLAVLADYVRGPGVAALDEDGVGAVSRLVEARQEALRQQTLCDGRILFADPPKSLTKQVRRYWAIAGEWPKAVASTPRRAGSNRKAGAVLALSGAPGQRVAGSPDKRLAKSAAPGHARKNVPEES
ncbi:MAG: CHAD domain-containing protein [Alphaproteobacteria bacterium]|nr:CHAD domain-containing protein [Alphaproteobacteria bacterium]